MHYKSLGRGGPALVFVHGWTCNLEFWSDQAGVFARTTRVLAVDLPGHGASEAPDAYSMDVFARAVEAAMRDAGVDRAVLIGHSMGALVIRQFSRLFPQKTIALVAVDGSFRPFRIVRILPSAKTALKPPLRRSVNRGSGRSGPYTK